MDEARFRSELRRFWDELAAGGPATPGDLDPELAATIRRVHVLRDVPAPDPAYARHLREDLMHAATVALPLPIGIPLNGRTAPPPVRPVIPPRSPGSRRTWPLAQAAIALLLIAAVIIGFFSYLYVRPHEQRMLVPGTPVATPAADWPMYKGNPGRTGVMAGPGPNGEPVEIWRFQAQGPVSRSPAIAGGIAYLQAGDGNIYALDALTGAEKWRIDLGDAGENTPTVAGEMVFVSTQSGALVALDAITGEERWRFAERVSADSTPLVVDGTLYIGSEDGSAYAIDPATGAERWRSSLAGPVGRSLAFAAGVVYAATGNGHLHAFDAATGEQRWEFVGNEEGIGTPSVADGVIYLNQQGTMYALDAATGAEQWRKSFEGARPLAVADGRVFSGGLDGVVYAVDAASGDQVWTFPTGDRIQAAPAVVGDTVYVASFDRTIYALDVATGEERWGFGIDGAADYGPTVANGMIYVGTDVGSLYALGGSGMKQIAAPAASAEPSGSAPAGQSDADSATPVTLAPVEQLWEYVDPEGLVRAISSVALAPDGNLWVLDGARQQFQILSPDGVEIERWGEPGKGPGQFNFQRDTTNAFGYVAWDADGGFYVADSHNFRIQQFDKDRNFVREWGGFGDGDGQFREPLQVLVDRAGDIYVVDDKRDDVQKFAPDGTFLLKFSGHGSKDGQMTNAGSGAFDADGNLWLADSDNSRVQQFTPDGEFLRAIGDAATGEGALHGPSVVTIDAAGRLIVGDFVSGRVMIYDPDGTFLMALDGTEGGGTKVATPDYVIVDGQGNLYVHDYGDRENIQKFRLLDPAIGGAPAATTAAAPILAPPTFLWQSTGGPDPLYSAAGLAVAPDGNIWIIDAGRNRIQILSPDGEFVEAWDGTGGGGETFNFANRSGGFDADVAFDAAGNIFVTEPGNRRVQVFAPDRTLKQTWGGRDSQEFLEPIGIVVDGADNAFVLDNDRNEIKKFDLSGALVATFAGNGPANFREASYLGIDGAGNLWIAADDRIVELSNDGTFLRDFGSTGDGPGQFHGTADVAVDASNIVYVTDVEHGWVQVFTTDGTSLAVWDAGRRPSGGQNLPFSVAPDNQGNLYLVGLGPDLKADSNVQKFRLPRS